MKKIFTLFTALLLAGAMWGTDYELMLTLDVAKNAPSGSTSTGLTDETLLSYLQGAAPKTTDITAASKTSGDVYKGKGSGGSGIPQACLKIGKASGGGAISFTIASTFDNIAKVELVGYGWKTDTKVSVNSSDTQSPETAASLVTFPYELSTPTKSISIAVTSSAFCATTIKLYKVADTGEPAIYANNINFETVYVPQGNNYTHQYSLDVTGLNLSSAISAESSDDSKVAVSGSLTKDGGKLTVDVTAPHGAFAETITLKSGETEKVVNVTGKVLENYASPVSVANALNAFTAGTLLADDSLQVRGLVKSISAYYTTGANVVIADMDDAEKEFTLYGIKSLNKANFASVDENLAVDINNVKFSVGDTLTAYGKVATYGEPAKPQIAAGGYLIEVSRNKAALVPEVTATPKSITLETADEAEGIAIELAYDYWEKDVTSVTAKLYSDEECELDITIGGWVSNFAYNAEDSKLTFDISENTVPAERTAYIRIKAENDDESAYALVAITQAAAPTLDTYKPTALANIKSTDVVIVTMSDDNKIYALSTDAATNANVDAVNITNSKAGNDISILSNAGIFWNIADSTSRYVLYPDGETKRWLTHSGSSATSRINTNANKFEMVINC